MAGLIRKLKAFAKTGEKRVKRPMNRYAAR